MTDATAELHYDVPSGERFLVRQITPADSALLKAGFENLSTQSRFFRFLTPRTSLSAADLEYLSAAASERRVAVGALHLGSNGPEPAGIARFATSAADAATAEFAIAVVDRYHGKGLGSLLLGVLIHIAVKRGVTRFEAAIHAENDAMLHLIEQLGGRETGASGAEKSVLLPVHPDPAAYPATPTANRVRDAFHAFDEIS